MGKTKKYTFIKKQYFITHTTMSVTDLRKLSKCLMIALKA